MICALCEQEVPDTRMSDHHLKTRAKDRFLTARLCSACHRTIHGLFSIKELRDEKLDLGSIEGLKRNPKIRKALEFVRKLPPGSKIKMSKPKHRRKKLHHWR